MATDRPGFGNRIAPPRFVLFVLLLVAGLGIGIPLLGWGRGTMAGFDFAAAIFLLGCLPLLNDKADEMRDAARANAANRVLLLVIVGVVMTAILAAVTGELAQEGPPGTAAIVLVVATLGLAWLFSNGIYALHYAYLFYAKGNEDGDSGGLDVPDCDEPTYWEFVYFAFTLGMAFQTSDVAITSTRMRRIATIHSLAAFVFNLGVVAFTINVLGGS